MAIIQVEDGNIQTGLCWNWFVLDGIKLQIVSPKQFEWSLSIKTVAHLIPIKILDKINYQKLERTYIFQFQIRLKLHKM